MKKLILLVPLFALFACDVQVEHEPEVTYLNMPGMAELDLPFSSAVRVGNTLYLSGNIGNIWISTTTQQNTNVYIGTQIIQYRHKINLFACKSSRRY